jgi:glutathionylspermidine synthase
MNYQENREKLFKPIKQEKVFTWDYMYGQEYALAATGQMSKSELAEMAYATEQLGHIFARIVSTLQQGSSDLMTELGLPVKSLAAVRIPIMQHWPTTIGRFDFARTSSGLKMLEFNSDTPSGVVEAFYFNHKVCEYYGYTDVNAGMIRHIAEAFAEIMSEYKSLGYATDHIVFSALDWHEEDSGTVRFLMDHSGLNALFVPLKSLRLYQDRLWHLTEGQLYPVDVLCRLHPLEILCEETDQDGYPIGEQVADLIVRRKLAVINQPGALLAQTKAIQALIWLLHERQEYFTPDEHNILDTYMLPTYFENRLIGQKPYVVKPVLGREGGAVTICSADGTELEKDSNGRYSKQNMIYQEYAELEQITIETAAGPYSGSLLWGSFLIGGKSSAINARVGAKITGDLSYCLPIRLL